MSAGKYGFFDFEEDESTDAIPGKLILTIHDPDGEEYATIVHRMTEGLDNDAIMDEKRERARTIVEALNLTY